MISFSFLKWRRHTHVLALFFFWTNSIFGQTYFDTSLDAYPSVSIAAPGDTVSFFIRINNEGQSDNTGLSVKCDVPIGLNFLQYTVPIGTSYDAATGIWQIGAALNSSTATLQMELKAVVVLEGILYLKTQVFSQYEMDVDSEPGNDLLLEDDMATTCVSIPFKICTAQGETVTLEAPAGFMDYQWYLDQGAGLVQVGNGQLFVANQPGLYSFTVNNAGCPLGLCCPVIVEEKCGQFYDVSLVKTLAPDQADTVDIGDEVRYWLTVTNEGEIPVSNIQITDFLPNELALGNNPINWVLSGSNMAEYTVPGPLQPGESATVEIVLQVLYGSSEQVIDNIAEVSSATDINGNPITDIDSTPNNGVDNEDDQDHQTIQLIPHDPTGYLYCENTGEIVTGGTIQVTGPGQVYIVSDGSTGYYEFYTDGTPGIYELTYNLPSGYSFNPDCTPQSGAIDPTGMAGPVVLGSDTADLKLIDFGCQSNPYFLSFSLEPGDPFIFNNNIPLVCPMTPVKTDTLVLVYNCDVTDPFFCMDIAFADRSDYSFQVNGQAYPGELGTCDYLRERYYSYGALLATGGQGPYRLESWSIAGNIFAADFQTIEELVAMMNQWDIFGNWAINETTHTIFGGNPQVFYGKLIIRQLGNGTEAILDLYQQFSSNSTYLNLPEGNNQVVVTNLLTAESDTYHLRIICVSPDYVDITMPVGTLDTICLNTDELAGEVIGVFNACGESIVTAADLDIIPDTVCVEVVALEPGETGACYVICDDAGICDTTYIHVTVTEDDFTLNPDTLFTAKNVPVIGEVLLNDIINDDIVSISILTQPENGTATVNADGTVSYVPNDGYCNDDGPLDQFEYQVCTATACHSTLVFVRVTCDGLVIYNGFSPNGDGVNDYFKIDGIGAYPNHIIMVFNRWGNKVFETQNYRNNWDGYWKDKRLPYGTYFYMIDLGDGSKWLSGYLQIWW